VKYSPPFALFYFVEGIFFGIGLALQFANHDSMWVMTSIVMVPLTGVTALIEASFHDYTSK